MKKNNIPKHIAIIMDGNRRWARARRLSIIAGHQKVADKMLEPLVEHAAKRGIKFLTFWAFSTENWQRNKDEVEGIMRIFRHVIKKRWQRLHEKGVRVRIIGDISKFASDISDNIKKVVEQTKNNNKITVIFALNYGGRDEILRAICRLHDRSKINKQNSKLSEGEFSKLLDTTEIPDPDLIVRTGGEQRLSGFLLWQSEYAELMFPKWLMPEFTPDKMDEILSEFDKRQRRFGK